MPKYVFCLNAGLVSARKGGGGGLSHVWGHNSAVEASVHVSRRPEVGGPGAVQPRQQVARWFLLSSPKSGGDIRTLGDNCVVERNHLEDASRAVGPRPARHGYPPLNIQSGRNDVKIATANGSSHRGATTTGSWSFLLNFGSSTTPGGLVFVVCSMFCPFSRESLMQKVVWRPGWSSPTRWCRVLG